MADHLLNLGGIAFSASETVFADVLVGDDGLARAVRFVRPSVSAALQEEKP